MNYQLKLTVGNSIKAVDGFYHILAFFGKIYCCHSYFAKLQPELQQIASELKIKIKKMGKVFDVRWVASSRRAVNALVHNYAAFCLHFEQLSESKFLRTHHRAMYNGMIRKMSTVQFVEDLVLVNTCSSELSK